jgi:hypothetical protein
MTSAARRKKPYSGPVCRARYEYGGNLCDYPARYLVIAPMAPKVVCGYHARQFLKRALIPIKYLGPNINIDQLPDINGFLTELKNLGAEVSIEDVSISINFGGVSHGKRATQPS